MILPQKGEWYQMMHNNSVASRCWKEPIKQMCGYIVPGIQLAEVSTLPREIVKDAKEMAAKLDKQKEVIQSSLYQSSFAIDSFQ